MSGLSLDFVVFVGDPDGGVALPSGKALAEIEELRDKLHFNEQVYGAVTLKKGTKDLFEPKVDPILTLLTQFVRAVPYVIDGEAETALLSESEHGFMFEPSSGEDLLISFFRGDAYEPDEYLLERETMKLEEFGEQVLGMVDRLMAMMKKSDPATLETDDYTKGLREFLDLARTSFKTYKLEKERGLRPR